MMKKEEERREKEEVKEMKLIPLISIKF